MCFYTGYLDDLHLQIRPRSLPFCSSLTLRVNLVPVLLRYEKASPHWGAHTLCESVASALHYSCHGIPAWYRAVAQVRLPELLKKAGNHGFLALVFHNCR